MELASSHPDLIQSEIKSAIRSRIVDFKDQSLTFLSFRRFLEKDLGLEPLALDLDFHKNFIKKLLAESSGEIVDSNVSSTSEPTKVDQSKNEVKQLCSEDKEKVKDSLVMGLLSEQKATKTESNKNELEEIKEVSEGELKKAIRKRASYVRANSHTATLAVLLRLLEVDMKLDKHDLHPLKNFIAKQLQEILPRKSKTMEQSQSTSPSKSSSKKNSDSSKHDNGVKEEDMELSEEEEISGRKIYPKRNCENSWFNKRKGPEKETNALNEKRIRAAENVADNGTDAEETRMICEGGRLVFSSAMKSKEALLTEPNELLDCLSSIRLKNEELKKAKEHKEEAKRQAEIAKEESKRAKEEAEESITGLKSKCVPSVRLKNEELKKAKELGEEVRRQAEKAKEEADESITGLKSKCVASVRLKNEELKKAKELAELAKRQAENAKEEAEKVKEEAEKSITGLKSKYVASVRLKNKELKKAKELAEEAQRQAEKAKKEAESAKEEAKKSVTGFKSKTENLERHIADLERQLEEARVFASPAKDDFQASKTGEELLGNLVGPYMEGAFHNFRMQAIADFPQLENRFKQYKLNYDMLIQSVETDDE